MSSVVEVKNVRKKYPLYEKKRDKIREAFSITGRKYHRDFEALKGISFSVEKGECVGIIGLNGSGKSTLLKILTGVVQPTEGAIRTNGKIAALLELGAGFNPEYTGMENIYLNTLLMGYTRAQTEEKIPEILEFADIGDFINQPVKIYSSGMFVRLAFAIAITVDPDILIVDEALSVGDVFFQAKCYRKFEEFKEMGKTILFVSHDLSSIGKYCDRVVLLNKGEKLAEGDAKEMVNLYRRVLVNQYDEPGEQNTMQEETPEVQEEKSTKDQLNLNPKVLEYGSKLAEIQDFAIRDKSGMVTNVIEKGEEFSVDMKIHFHETIQEPIFAFTIKDLKGTEITGTNTMYENTPVGTQKAGETRRITFTQKMPLEAGEYMLCLGCTGYRDGDFTVFHRLYDVCNLTVITDKKAVGYFDLFSKVTLK